MKRLNWYLKSHEQTEQIFVGQARLITIKPPNRVGYLDIYKSEYFKTSV